MVFDSTLVHILLQFVTVEGRTIVGGYLVGKTVSSEYFIQLLDDVVRLSRFHDFHFKKFGVAVDQDKQSFPCGKRTAKD